MEPIRYNEMPKDDDEFIYLTMKALVAQGGPSTEYSGPRRGLCEYRLPNGRACAVGFWMSDEEADRCADLSADCVYKDFYAELPRIFAFAADRQELLIDMQGFHDDASRRVMESPARQRPDFDERGTWINALFATAYGRYVEPLRRAVAEYERGARSE